MKRRLNIKIISIGVALTLIFAYYLYAVVLIDYGRTPFYDLLPYPDTAEYFAAAKLLHTERIYAIQLGDMYLPPRYPALFSMMQLPLFFVFDALGRTDFIRIPFITNHILGFLTLSGVVSYFLYKKVPVGAVTAGALLVTQPAFIVAARSGMSETASVALVLIYFLMCAVAVERRSLRLLSAAALFIGIATMLRVPFIAYTPLVFFASLLIIEGRTPLRKTRNVLAYNTGAALLFVFGASPMLLYNWASFGSPFSTGYGFHLPWLTFSETFNTRFVGQHLANFWTEFTLSRDEWNWTASYMGAGMYYTPVFFILALLSVIAWSTKRLANLLFVLPVVAFLIMSVLYYFLSPRLYATAGVLAILPIAWTAERFIGRTPRQWKVPSWVFALLLALTIIGFPSVAGLPLKGPRVFTYELTRRTYIETPPLAFFAVQRFQRVYNDEPALIVSDLNPVYINSLLEGPVYAIPLSYDLHVYSQIQESGIYPNEILNAEVATAFAEGRQVYFVSNTQSLLETNPLLKHYIWVGMDDNGQGTVIFRLAGPAG